ncbi:MAG: hypothetical protein KA354_23000 [Phycisphaerae bacterium]|nr:hypothetical protein [Phycisphaerae bacterium]
MTDNLQALPDDEGRFLLCSGSRIAPSFIAEPQSLDQSHSSGGAAIQ